MTEAEVRTPDWMFKHRAQLCGHYSNQLSEDDVSKAAIRALSITATGVCDNHPMDLAHEGPVQNHTHNHLRHILDLLLIKSD